MAERLDFWWFELGRPDPFTVAEVGAGDGQRAAEVLGLGPLCLSALRYVLVEDDAALRAQQSGHLPIESPILVLGPVGPPDGEEERTPPPSGIGPLVTSLSELPVIEGPTSVLVMGWLSRLPSDRFVWKDAAWWEVRLVAAADGGLGEMLVPADPEPVPVKAPVEDARYARLGPACDWLAGALAVAEQITVGVVDRWTRFTEPVQEGEVPPLAANQLGAVRRPLETRPEELFSGLSVLSWAVQ